MTDAIRHHELDDGYLDDLFNGLSDRFIESSYRSEVTRVDILNLFDLLVKKTSDIIGDECASECAYRTSLRINVKRFVYSMNIQDLMKLIVYERSNRGA